MLAENKKTSRDICHVVGCIVIITLLVVIALPYIFGVNVPGLRGKTLWDWLQLLIIPAVLAIGGYLFNYSTSRNERNAADRRNQTEREIAQDNQCEAALQEYINKMSELLLDRKLRESTEDAEVRTIARVRTLTVLPRLDPIRKKSMLQFLHESSLIDKKKPVIDLSGAEFMGADFSIGQFSNANLSKALFRGAHLFAVNFSKTDLTVAELSYTDLHKANLRGADLGGAILFGANLSEADLGEANLSWTQFTGANLSEANLKDAKNIIIEKLEQQAKSLKGATMPDGSIHP